MADSSWQRVKKQKQSTTCLFRKKELSYANNASGSGKLVEITAAFVEVGSKLTAKDAIILVDN